MNLTPRKDKLLIAMAAVVARGFERGVKLNHPEPSRSSATTWWRARATAGRSPN